MTTPIKYKARMICMSASNTPGVDGEHNVTIGGKRKADGPSYLTETLKVLAVAGDGPDIMDFRLNVLSIHTFGHYFHYVCQAIVAMKDETTGLAKPCRDTIHVYIDHRTIEEIPAEE